MSEKTPESHQSNSSDEESSVDAVNFVPPSNKMPESTAANSEDCFVNNNNNDDSSASDSALAKGLSSIISSVIRDFDSSAEETLRSQDQLSFSIDRLTRELDQLLEDAPLPFIMQHAAKISGVRKRVSSLNTVLKSIQRRVDNIDRMVSAGLPHEKLTSGSAGHH